MEKKELFKIDLEYLGDGLWFYEDRDIKFYCEPPIEIVGVMSARLGAQMQRNIDRDLHWRYEINICRINEE